MLHHVNIGLKVKQCVHQIPSVTMEASIQPITRTVLRVTLSICPDFTWNDQVKVENIYIHGKQKCLHCSFNFTSLHLSLTACRKFLKEDILKTHLKHYRGLGRLSSLVG